MRIHVKLPALAVAVVTGQMKTRHHSAAGIRTTASPASRVMPLLCTCSDVEAAVTAEPNSNAANANTQARMTRRYVKERIPTRSPVITKGDVSSEQVDLSLPYVAIKTIRSHEAGKIPCLHVFDSSEPVIGFTPTTQRNAEPAVPRAHAMRQSVNVCLHAEGKFNETGRNGSV